MAIERDPLASWRKKHDKKNKGSNLSREDVYATFGCAILLGGLCAIVALIVWYIISPPITYKSYYENLDKNQAIEEYSESR